MHEKQGTRLPKARSLAHFGATAMEPPAVTFAIPKLIQAPTNMSLMEKLLAESAKREAQARDHSSPPTVSRRDEFGDLGDPVNLTKELALLYKGYRQSKLRAQARLEEIIQLGYGHKETYAHAMVLKYSALELQALCGLASLAAKPACSVPDGGGKAAS